MKVLMINSDCGFGSTGRICTDIADALIKEGHQCKIVYGRDGAPEKYKDISYKVAGELSVRLNALNARFRDNDGFNAKHATKRLVKWIDEYDPDVIHLHNLHGYYINAEILFNYLKTSRAKIVWTLHDCWTFTGHCSHFTMVKCEQWKTHCSYCKQPHSYPKSYIDRAKRNFAKKKELFTGLKNLTIVTPSQWLADLVKQSYLRDYPVQVIHNGIDLNVFKPTPSDFRKRYGLEGKRIILGVASIWDQRKGIDDFIKLAGIIDGNTRIVLVGLKKKQAKGLPENIIAIERTNNVTELAEIYTTADLFFNPTYEDNYPTVNLEAQACGTPVVTYPTGGSPESVPQENVIEKGSYEKTSSPDEGWKFPPPSKEIDKRTMLKNYLSAYCQ